MTRYSAKQPGTVHADADGVAAQVTTAGAAVAAVAAGDVAFARDAIADLEARHLAADLDDLAAVLVARRPSAPGSSSAPSASQL